MSAYVCVCERERERETERNFLGLHQVDFFRHGHLTHTLVEKASVLVENKTKGKKNKVMKTGLKLSLSLSSSLRHGTKCVKKYMYTLDHKNRPHEIPPSRFPCHPIRKKSAKYRRANV